MEFDAHAYVAEGGENAITAVRAFLVEAGIAQGANLYVRAHTHFGVDVARELRERASLRAWGGGEEGRRAFVVAASVITTEAQNALLKTIEEPPANAVFILLVPSPHTLLPTLLSRMQRLEVEVQQHEAAPIDAHAFFAAPPAKRLEMLKKILDAEERDVGGAIAFLSECERELARSFDASAHSATREGIEAVYRARRYIADKGALMKLLLEQVALLALRV